MIHLTSLQIRIERGGSHSRTAAVELQFPPSLQSLEQLAELTIQFPEDNHFIIGPVFVCPVLPNTLRILQITHANLQCIPEHFAGLRLLEELNLHHNRIPNLPPFIFEWIQLRHLNLCYNRLGSIPPMIAHLTSLESLDWSYNYLRNLPAEISELAHLHTLKLTGTSLIHSASSSSTIKSLTHLDVGSNSLSLDDFISLSSLKTLKLWNNRIAHLPEQLHWHQLLQLDLSSNQLFSLPESIGDLQLLRKLDLYDNQLQCLPEQLTRCQNLKELCLSHNRFTVIPGWIARLPNLLTLDVHANPLKGEQKAFADSNLLLSYLRHLYNASAPLKSCHFVFIGSGKAGKTTIRNAILAERPGFWDWFQSSKLVPPTDRTTEPTFTSFSHQPRTTNKTNPLTTIGATAIETNRYYRISNADNPFGRTLKVEEHSCSLIPAPDFAIYDSLVCSRCGGIHRVEQEDIEFHPYQCIATVGCSEPFILCGNCAKKEIDAIKLQQQSPRVNRTISSKMDVSFTFTDLPGQSEFFASYSHFISIPNAMIVVVTSIEPALQLDSQGEWCISTAKLESDCRLWCSLVNQMTAAGKRIATAKSFLILTHVDLLKDTKRKWKSNTKAEFESWVNRMQHQLPLDYPHMNLCGEAIVRLNACEIEQVQNRLWEKLLIPAAEELLSGQTTPRYLVGLRKQLQEAQSPSHKSSLPPYLPRHEAIEWLTRPPFQSGGERSAEQALICLINVGEVIQLRDGTIVFNREWLSRLISTVLKSSAPPFDGIKMENGIVKYSLLEDYLLKQTLNDAPLFLDPTEIQEVLHILSELDLIVLSREMKSNWNKIDELTETETTSTSKLSTTTTATVIPPMTPTMSTPHVKSSAATSTTTSITQPVTIETICAVETITKPMTAIEIAASSSATSVRLAEAKLAESSASTTTAACSLLSSDLDTFIFIPSRSDQDWVEMAVPPPETRHVYGRRLSFRHPSSRFPPGTIARMVCWLGGFDPDPFPKDYSRWQIHMKLGDYTHAYICLDQNHQHLDLLMWDQSENGTEIAAVGEKLMNAAKWSIAMQLGDRDGNRQIRDGRGSDSVQIEEKSPFRSNSISTSVLRLAGTQQRQSMEYKRNSNSQLKGLLPAVVGVTATGSTRESIMTPNRAQWKELTELDQILTVSFLCPQCILRIAESQDGPSAMSTDRFHYQYSQVSLASPLKANSAFWICDSKHQHKDTITSLYFPRPRLSTPTPNSPEDISVWSFDRVRDWFISDQPLHDHFFRQLGSRGKSSWNGRNLVSQIFRRKLDGSTAGEKAIHQMLEEQGYGFLSLRRAFIDGLYRLKENYSLFRQQQSKNHQSVSSGPIYNVNINSNNTVQGGKNASIHAGDVNAVGTKITIKGVTRLPPLNLTPPNPFANSHQS